MRAYEQDPERVWRWKEQEYPAIHAEAAAAGASIFFADEAGVGTDYHAGTTWAPVGCTLVMVGTGARLSMNMISAVSAQGKMHLSFIEGNTNAATFIEKLLHDIEGKIFLIVDELSAHTQPSQPSPGDCLRFLPGSRPQLYPSISADIHSVSAGARGFKGAVY